jgi:HlyD family secretion protein
MLIFKRRVLGWSLVLLAIGAAVAWSFRPAAPDVEVASAVKAPMEVTLDQEGRTHIEDRYVVSAPVTGYARRIALKAGDDVKAATPLVVLEPQVTEGLDPRSEAEARADISRATAALRSAEAARQARDAERARAAQREQRLRKASGAGAVTQDDLDAASADLRKADAEARAFVGANASAYASTV